MSLYGLVGRTLSSLCSFVGYFAITMFKFGGGDCSVGRVLALKIWRSELIFKKACVKIKASCGCTPAVLVWGQTGLWTSGQPAAFTW